MTRLRSQDERRAKVLLLGLVAAVYGALCLRPDWMTLLGVSNLNVWFLDTRAVLAASDAHALGIDPSFRNPLDLLQQPHVYSYWWFALHGFGVMRSDHLWLGAALGAVFLLVAITQVRTRSGGELLWSAAFVTAPPVILGFNRGNADLLVFILLACVAPCLVSKRRWLNGVAVVAVALAAGLKYYPAVAAVLWLTPRPSEEKRMDLILLTALLLAVVLDQAASMGHYWSDPHAPEGFFCFGAGIAAKLLELPGWVGPAAAAALVGVAACVSLRLAPRWAPPAECRREYLQFILGAVLLVACYLATINYSYRAVFAIWMAPFLWTAWQNPNWPRYHRWLGRSLGVLIAAFLWSDGFACLSINLSGRLTLAGINDWTDALVLAQQPIVALLIAGLLGFLIPFMRDGLFDLFQRRAAAP